MDEYARNFPSAHTNHKKDTHPSRRRAAVAKLLCTQQKLNIKTSLYPSAAYVRAPYGDGIITAGSFYIRFPFIATPRHPNEILLYIFFKHIMDLGCVSSNPPLCSTRIICFVHTTISTREP